MSRRTIFAALAALTLAPAGAAAQDLSADRNRFALEPYAGAYRDGYAPDGAVGGLVGLRLGYRLSGRFRLVADAAYAEVNRVGKVGLVGPDMVIYGNDWALTTIGAEWDAAPGRTSATLGLRVGLAWRAHEAEGVTGNPSQQWLDYADSDGFSVRDAVVPSFSVRHQFNDRLALRLSAEDYMLDLAEGPVKHSPAVTLGVSIR